MRSTRSICDRGTASAQVRVRIPIPNNPNKGLCVATLGERGRFIEVIEDGCAPGIAQHPGSRARADVTQTQLGRRLGRSQPWVSKVETGERRLDVIEFAHLCREKIRRGSLRKSPPMPVRTIVRHINAHWDFRPQTAEFRPPT